MGFIRRGRSGKDPLIVWRDGVTVGEAIDSHWYTRLLARGGKAAAAKVLAGGKIGATATVRGIRARLVKNPEDESTPLVEFSGEGFNNVVMCSARDGRGNLCVKGAHGKRSPHVFP